MMEMVAFSNERSVGVGYMQTKMTKQEGKFVLPMMTGNQPHYLVAVNFCPLKNNKSLYVEQ